MWIKHPFIHFFSILTAVSFFLKCILSAVFNLPYQFAWKHPYAASQLAQMLDIPVFDLDQLFWDSSSDHYGVRTPEDTRDNKLRDILQKDKWILEGVYHSWLYDSFAQADMIIILNPNHFLRTWRIFKRCVKRKLRLTQSKKEGIKDLVRVIIWNHKYNGDNLRCALEFIKEFDNKTICVDRADDAVFLIKNKA